MTPRFTLTDTHDTEKIETLAQKLMNFNAASSAVPLNHRALTIYVTDPETYELLGGLWAAQPIPLSTSSWFIFLKICVAQA